MSEQDAAGETWEVTTTGGPIKYVRGDQEFDLSRVVGRWKMRDYLNALTREAADLRRENEALREALATAQRDFLQVQATTTTDYDSASLLGQDVFNDCFNAIKRIDTALAAQDAAKPGDGA